MRCSGRLKEINAPIGKTRSGLVPDYYVHATDRWLVFPHEIVGLTREEILAHKPVGEEFFNAV